MLWSLAQRGYVPRTGRGNVNANKYLTGAEEWRRSEYYRHPRWCILRQSLRVQYGLGVRKFGIACALRGCIEGRSRSIGFPCGMKYRGSP